MIAGHRTRVSLEEAFWQALKRLAAEHGVSVNHTWLPRSTTAAAAACPVRSPLPALQARLTLEGSTASGRRCERLQSTLQGDAASISRGYPTRVQ
ncbi:MAG: ribbon-helix-helix domain-containing protein [Alphaproteobacteria bacterium]